MSSGELDDLDVIFGTSSNIPAPSKSIDPFDDPIRPTATFELTIHQQKKAVRAWKEGKQGLKELTEAVFGKGYDGRSREGVSLRKYLASIGLIARPAHIYPSKSDGFVLNQEQKDTITKMAINSKPLEIARVMFKNDKMTPLYVEAKEVRNFYNALDPSLRLVKDKQELTEKYNPPKSEGEAISRVNVYTYNTIDIKKVTNYQKDCIKKLIKYTHTHRYISEMNNLVQISEREVFESSFIRFVWDKPDLTEEDIDLYLNLCFEIIHFQRMKNEEEAMIQARNDIMEQENGRMPQTYVDMIGKIRSAINESFNRQQTMIKDLNVKRSDRMKSKIQQNASILNLVEAFKDSSRRKQIMDLVKARKDKLKNEVGRLKNMDHLKFELFGLGEDEAYGGG